ncbi:MAG: hypothetical protein K2M19_02040 [Muribaculaceae bacterium]|nr:hypothetical protein [Muribaculaceae bacterium]
MKFRILPFVHGLLAIFFLCAELTVGAQEVTTDGLKFKKGQNGALLIGFTDDIAADVVVPASVEINERMEDVTFWRANCLNAAETEIPASHVKSITMEDGDADLWIFGESISGWTELKTIEFPQQLTQIDCDAIINCPALESVTFRGNRVVSFEYPNYNLNFSMGSQPTVYVNADLVDEYKALKEKDQYAQAFLSQCGEILAIGGNGVPSGVHILLGDLHLNAQDAKPGDRISIEAPDGATINSIALDNKPINITDSKKAEIEIPDFNHHMVMAVNLSSTSQSSQPDITDRHYAVRGTESGVAIDGYDGSLVLVIDLSGREVAKTHRSHIALNEGIYIVFYGNQGYKICVNR